MRCHVCFRHCDLKEGQVGFCKARRNENGVIVASNYGYITSLAFDPIEKKPLKEFYPGSHILSLGSYGCNLRCPFCQNHEISQHDLSSSRRYEIDDILNQAIYFKEKYDNIGIAYTYNEPLIGYEFVRDLAKKAKANNLKNVLVTNGCASIEVLEEILPYIDAMNIDLKGFDEKFFAYIGSSLEMTKAFIEKASQSCHVELTTLIIPKRNDDEYLFDEECKWISSISPAIPLHITRYFPRYKETAPMTSFLKMENLKMIASKYLKSVYLGNI